MSAVVSCHVCAYDYLYRSSIYRSKLQSLHAVVCYAACNVAYAYMTVVLSVAGWTINVGVIKP